MTWQPTDTWPSSEESTFRDRSERIERDFVCRKLSTRERVLFRTRPKKQQVVTRFCVTTLHLYAELADGSMCVIDKSALTSVEILGAHLGIGTGDSLLFFLPQYGESNHEAILALFPLRPRLLSPTPSWKPVVLLLGSVLWSGLGALGFRAQQMQATGESPLLSYLGYSAYFVALLLSILVGRKLWSERVVVDTRGLVRQGGFRTETGTAPTPRFVEPGSEHATSLHMWTSELVLSFGLFVVLNLCVFASAVYLAIAVSTVVELALSKLPLGLWTIAAFSGGLFGGVVLYFVWRWPTEVTLEANSIKLYRPFGKTKVIEMTKEKADSQAPHNPHFILLGPNSQHLVLETGDHCGPMMLRLSRLKVLELAQNARRRERPMTDFTTLAETLASQYSLPIIDVSSS